MEVIHNEFTAAIPHPELHGGKSFKNIWAQMEDDGMGFLEFIEKHNLDRRRATSLPTWRA